jgi:uncharacterized protein (TIGR03067 family)
MRLVVSLVACVFLVAAEDSAKDKKAAAALAGSWDVVSIDRGEKSGPDVSTFVFGADGKLTVKSKERSEEMTYKIDDAKNPKEIDLSPKGAAPGMAIKGIFSVKGDELKLCVAGDPRLDRPKEFASKKNAEITYVILKRSKK